MKTIQLTRGKVTQVDDGDYAMLSRFKWQAHKRRTGGFEAVRHAGYVNGQSKSVTMSQEIMGHRDGFIVDHKNGDSLDNQRENLRWATRSQNSINWKRRNQTGARGVFANGSRFTARIKALGSRITLGTFSSIEAARDAYAAAADKLHGEFAIKETA